MRPPQITCRLFVLISKERSRGFCNATSSGGGSRLRDTPLGQFTKCEALELVGADRKSTRPNLPQSLARPLAVRSMLGTREKLASWFNGRFNRQRYDRSDLDRISLLADVSGSFLVARGIDRTRTPTT